MLLAIQFINYNNMKNIIIFISFYLFISMSNNATIYDEFKDGNIAVNTDLEMLNVSYDPLNNSKAIITNVKQCYSDICQVALDVKTSSFIQLPDDSAISNYILGDNYHFKFIKKSTNTAIIYTIDNKHETNLTIITSSGDIYPLHLITNTNVADLVVNISKENPIEIINTDASSVIVVIDKPSNVTKTVAIGTLTEYLDIDLTSVSLKDVLGNILLGWDIRFNKNVNTNKIVSLTAEISSKLTRKEAVEQILAKLNYRALFYNQKKIVIITTATI